MAGPTNFVESNVLLALLEGDDEEAQRLLKGLFVGELRELQDAAAELDELCGTLIREKREGRV